VAEWAALASLAVVTICAAIPVSAAVPITPTVDITLSSVRVVTRPVVVTIPVVAVPIVPVLIVPVPVVAVPVVAVPIGVIAVPIGTSSTLTLVTTWDSTATDTSDATARAGGRIGLEFEELLADTLPRLVLLSRLQIGEARLVISRGVDEARDLVYELPLGLFWLSAPLKLLQLRL
jgi:hypothetical protein